VFNRECVFCNIVQAHKSTVSRNCSLRDLIQTYFRCLTKSDYEVRSGNLMKTTRRRRCT